MPSVKKLRIAAIACLIISAAAALVAAPLLLLKAGSIPAAIALYPTSLILYGAGAALAIYTEDPAALNRSRPCPTTDPSQAPEKTGDPAK